MPDGQEPSDPLRPTPEIVAAFTNAILVFAIPVASLIVDWRNVDPSVPRPPGYSGAAEIIASALASPFVLLPVLVGWRTYSHARQYRLNLSRGWLAVAEAGLLGFGIALWILRNGIMTRPAEAPMYILVYGGAAVIIGLVVGVVLRTTAILVLGIFRTHSKSHGKERTA